MANHGAKRGFRTWHHLGLYRRSGNDFIQIAKPILRPADAMREEYRTIIEAGLTAT